MTPALAPAARAPGKKSILDLLAQPHAVQYLPSLRTILRELEEKTSLQHVAIQEIADIIRTDQSLSLRLIRLANSGYFSLGQPIVDLEEAILYLGLNNVRTVVFTARCIETTAALKTPELPWPAFWKHSVAVASILRVLAPHLRRELQPLPAENYYLLGLLHDIGKLVLALLAPQPFESLLREARQRNAPLHVLELEYFGVDHAAIGAWYLQKQGLPAATFEAVRLHHNHRVDNSRLRHAYLLHVADRLAHHLGLGQSGSADPVNEHPCRTAGWLDYVSRCWEPLEDPSRALPLIEEELARLPDLVNSIAP